MPKLQIIVEEGALYKNTDFLGCAHLDRYSCVSNSSFGKYIGVGCFSYISRSRIQNYVSIGSRCSIGGYEHPINWLSTAAFQWKNSPWEDLNIIGSNAETPKQHTTSIGNDVWVGDNAVILQGVFIPNGVIVGANSIVTKSPPAFSIIAGNPAVPIKMRFNDEIIAHIERTKWWDLPIRRLTSIEWSNPIKALKRIDTIKREL